MVCGTRSVFCHFEPNIAPDTVHNVSPCRERDQALELKFHFVLSNPYILREGKRHPNAGVYPTDPKAPAAMLEEQTLPL